MILYKYYGFESGLMALQSQQLGFRTPCHFNDPFELSSVSNRVGPNRKLGELEALFSELEQQVLVLSLTRTFDNALMWSHYAGEHCGFVIGYDTDVLFLNDYAHNIIPVSSGDVLYSYTKNQLKVGLPNIDTFRQVCSVTDGHDMSNSPELQALARKVFLTKHASWVYEEEVRVVKKKNNNSEHSLSERTEIPAVPGLSIFATKIPIKEVHVGVRNEVLSPHSAAGDRFRDALNALGNKCHLYQMEMDTASWSLMRRPVS